VSSDKSFLYLKETIDPNVIGSSFFPVSEEMLLDFVNHLNEINDYYLKAGFKKVLISIPANPVAILQTEEKPTNQLLTRLRKHPNLKVELVDPSDSLKVNASQNYFKSDSHWNTNGAKIWLTYLNRSLEKI
jgi:RNase H-fold protein (predicted Holliday junction resolvase)